jgi:hypothetical protein
LISVLKGWGTVLLLIDLLTSFRYLELRALIDDIGMKMRDNTIEAILISLI